MELGKIIGRGNTATVYEWQDNKVLKLYNQGYPQKAVEKEFRNAIAINNMDFEKPKAYEIIKYNDRLGIIYDKVSGEPLMDWLMRTKDINKCAEYMAAMHKSILKNSINDVPDYKDFLRFQINKAPTERLKSREEILKKFDKLPEGNSLCHGDFHPSNIFINNGRVSVIDFMNVCHGHYLYDVARTVFLIQYTPVSDEFNDKETMLSLKKLLADFYLKHMNITRDEIQDFLTVIIASRLGEVPSE